MTSIPSAALLNKPGLLARAFMATIALISLATKAQTLPLPIRGADATLGGDFARSIISLPLAAREERMLSQILSGNVPNAVRRLCPVTVTNATDGQTNLATFYVTSDYLAVGADHDYFLTPLTPTTAQLIADRLDCTLPTRRMVDAIYAAADVKLAPSPIPPSPAMITLPVFLQHDDIVRTQRVTALKQLAPGVLMAGHKKDVVITPKLATATNKVAIYGWHQTNGQPIQPLYLGHTAAWVDYSHGIRLVSQQMLVNGQTTTVARVLADPVLASLVSDEGPITSASYARDRVSLYPQRGENSPIRSSRFEPLTAEERRSPDRPGAYPDRNRADREVGAPVPGAGLRVRNGGTSTREEVTFKRSSFNERIAEFTFDPEVRIQINTPAQIAPDQPVLLILYALPNGNTIEQTVGKKLQPGDDWHFDLQHVGAQTRFLRERLTNTTVVVAYLEAEMKSWPAWRRKHGDTAIPGIINRIKALFSTNQLEVVLTGHSGGGSFTFGYVNTRSKIPDEVVRLAFLDSNYAYETTNHQVKLTAWLKSSPRHALCVLAYHDSIALLDGKTFVSERGGTWGRSHAMLADLGAQFPFTSRTNAAGRQTHLALDGRLQLLLQENPERKILHTVQVERNGFIHALLTGTPLEGQGYEYFGERAYTRWIEDE